MISGIHIQGMPLIICYQYIKIYMNNYTPRRKFRIKTLNGEVIRHQNFFLSEQE